MLKMSAFFRYCYWARKLIFASDGVLLDVSVASCGILPTPYYPAIGGKLFCTFSSWEVRVYKIRYNLFA